MKKDVYSDYADMGMKVNRKILKEIIVGIILVGSLILYFCFCTENQKQNQNLNGTEFMVDSSLDRNMNDVLSYYNGLKVMTEEKFTEQQCGNLGEAIFYVQDNHNPMSIQVNNVLVEEILSESELAMVEESVFIYTGDICNWNCFLQNRDDNAQKVNKEDVEEISKYVFVDVTLENMKHTELFLYLKEFKLLVTKHNKKWNKEFYTTRKGTLVPYGFKSINSVLISADNQIEYVSVNNSTDEMISYYREMDRAMATIKDAFYVDDTMNIRLMFVCTDEEIESGRLTLCSDMGNASKNGQFTNQGFVIELGEEIKNAADNQSGDE